MKYFFKMDDSFMNFRKSLAKTLINNYYMNENTREIPSNTIKRKNHKYWRLQLPMILNTIKKCFAHKNINTHNTSVIGKMLKNNL